MKVGKRSLLFGVHQVFWHPFTVIVAWWSLYGRPSWRDLVCIIIHDWGYWFTSNMDGMEGERHPEYAAKLAGKWFGPKYQNLCLYHSRSYSKKAGKQPSRLCWADKLSVKYDPWWFYILRAWVSGELHEYRQEAAKDGLVPLSAGHREWHHYFRGLFIELAKENTKVQDTGEGDVNGAIFVLFKVGRM